MSLTLKEYITYLQLTGASSVNPENFYILSGTEKDIISQELSSLLGGSDDPPIGDVFIQKMALPDGDSCDTRIIINGQQVDLEELANEHFEEPEKINAFMMQYTGFIRSLGKNDPLRIKFEKAIEDNSIKGAEKVLFQALEETSYPPEIINTINELKKQNPELATKPFAAQLAEAVKTLNIEEFKQMDENAKKMIDWYKDNGQETWRTEQDFCGQFEKIDKDYTQKQQAINEQIKTNGETQKLLFQELEIKKPNSEEDWDKLSKSLKSMISTLAKDDPKREKYQNLLNSISKQKELFIEAQKLKETYALDTQALTEKAKKYNLCNSEEEWKALCAKLDRGDKDNETYRKDMAEYYNKQSKGLLEDQIDNFDNITEEDKAILRKAVSEMTPDEKKRYFELRLFSQNINDKDFANSWKSLKDDGLLIGQENQDILQKLLQDKIISQSTDTGENAEIMAFYNLFLREGQISLDSKKSLRHSLVNSKDDNVVKFSSQMTYVSTAAFLSSDNIEQKAIAPTLNKCEVRLVAQEGTQQDINNVLENLGNFDEETQAEFLETLANSENEEYRNMAADYQATYGFGDENYSGNNSDYFGGSDYISDAVETLIGEIQPTIVSVVDENYLSDTDNTVLSEVELNRQELEEKYKKSNGVAKLGYAIQLGETDAIAGIVKGLSIKEKKELLNSSFSGIDLKTIQEIISAVKFSTMSTIMVKGTNAETNELMTLLIEKSKEYSSIAITSNDNKQTETATNLVTTDPITNEKNTEINASTVEGPTGKRVLDKSTSIA